VPPEIEMILQNPVPIIKDGNISIVASELLRQDSTPQMMGMKSLNLVSKLAALAVRSTTIHLTFVAFESLGIRI
jgi:hypothetical protein